ncbi:MAG: DUF547 domain-containing protein [Bradymonadales bacterium]|nr:DUF547 domain-containing protein [Bradymonadales bacterium]
MRRVACPLVCGLLLLSTGIARSQSPEGAPCEEEGLGEQEEALEETELIEDGVPFERGSLIFDYLRQWLSLFGFGTTNNRLYPDGWDHHWSTEVPESFDHGEWDRILAGHVNEEGLFDYGALSQDSAQRAFLDGYLGRLAEASLQGLVPAEQLAFWINAYNACAVQNVLTRGLPQSVLEVEGFFDDDLCRIGGYSLSLNEIENERIRRFFVEPRIHFALNGAAHGCPPLRREAYRGNRLEVQLEDQATRFLRATTVIDTNRMEIRANRILEWFGWDFEPIGGVREFIAQRLEAEEARLVRLDSYRLVFSEFDWRLNQVP